MFSSYYLYVRTCPHNVIHNGSAGLCHHPPPLIAVAHFRSFFTMSGKGKSAKAPKKGSKKDIEAQKAAAAKVVSNTTAAEGHDDGGRVATGSLISEPRARDIKINAFSLALHGCVLVEDTVIELNQGARYGLLGRNGCGKSTFLKCLAAREVPIPSHFDIYLLAHEAPPTDRTALEYVIDSARDEVARLEQLVEDILVDQGPECDLLNDLYERLDELDPSTFETRASTILVGLGFKPAYALLLHHHVDYLIFYVVLQWL
jgi:ATP-binding cassette subfamily F protein 2